ncbi:ABC transporter substrate-binding protein [Polaromonas sp.]|uniref:ABC transporter substrate-binding protein n=1 Tax=Polaromonas sp. TaxID=1869339 RepID=UPI00326455DC
MKFLANTLLALVLGACATAVTARTLVVGQVAELSGLANADENALGARLWFDHASVQGPHRYVVKALDDQRDPKQTVLQTRKLVEEDKVVALFGYRSTPSLSAVAPLLEELQIPLVGPYNGSESVRTKGGNWMFFLRATYQDEISRLVEHVRVTGIRNVAIVHQQDPFGTEQSKAFATTLEAAGIKPANIYSYDRKTLDTKDVIQGLTDTRPQAVLMACTSQACASIIKKIRETNEKMMFLTLSNAVNDELLQSIAKVGRGVLMSQVMPFPWNSNVAIVKEFDRLNKAAKVKVPVSHAALEGFASAKLLTIAATKAGPQADASRIAEVLRTTGPIDLGGIVYSPMTKGGRYVDLTMVSRDGRLIR